MTTFELYEDQFIEVAPTDYGMNPILSHIGTWVLDSVKITTKEYLVQEGVAYEVLMWIPEPDKKDTLEVIDDQLLSWNKYEGVFHSLAGDTFTINRSDTLIYRLLVSSDNALLFRHRVFIRMGGKKFSGRSLKIDSLFYFLTQTIMRCRLKTIFTNPFLQ